MPIYLGIGITFVRRVQSILHSDQRGSSQAPHLCRSKLTPLPPRRAAVNEMRATRARGSKLLDHILGTRMSTGENEMERLELSEDANSTAYGSVSTTASPSESEDFFDEENVDSVGGLNREGRARSFHLRGALTHNVWTSMRPTTSFAQHGEEYQRVPTHLEDNVKLIVDPNLEAKEKGTLYYAQESFYVNSEKPRYALTIAPDIYRRVFAEVADAKTIPCGLYFCCHGGDGAHTGVSHDDYVDISVAWVLVGIVFTFLISVSMAPSTSYVDFSD